jgi:hypothetical protein
MEMPLRVQEVGVHESGKKHAQEEFSDGGIAKRVGRLREIPPWFKVWQHPPGTPQRVIYGRVSRAFREPGLEIRWRLEATVMPLNEWRGKREVLRRELRPGSFMIWSVAARRDWPHTPANTPETSG